VAETGHLALGGLQRSRQLQELAELLGERHERLGHRGQRRRHGLEHLDVPVHRLCGVVQRGDGLVQRLLDRRVLLDLVLGPAQQF
jgi:hypothetical protein